MPTKARVTMTEEEVIKEFRLWFDMNGEPPTKKELEGMALLHDAIHHFGTFTGAVIAAGFYPRVRTKKWRETDEQQRCGYLRDAIAALKRIEKMAPVVARTPSTPITKVVRQKEKVAA